MVNLRSLLYQKRRHLFNRKEATLKTGKDTPTYKNQAIDLIKKLKYGSHLGRNSEKVSQQKSFQPEYSKYLLGTRTNLSIIDPTKTWGVIMKSFLFLILVLRKGGHVLVINGALPELTSGSFAIPTLKIKKQQPFSNIVDSRLKAVKKIAPRYKTGIEKSSQASSKNISLNNIKPATLSSSADSWVGGCLTNWKQVSKSVKSYASFYRRFDKFLAKNSIEFPRYRKIKNKFQGFVLFTIGSKKNTPDLIFIMNPNNKSAESKTILQEATRLHIPVMALTDPSTPYLSQITYPIPVNNSSIHEIFYYLNSIFLFRGSENK
jgi:ribosomal protein S2